MSCPPAVSYMGGQEEEEEEEVRSNTSLSSELAQRQEGGHKSQPVDMSQVRGQATLWGGNGSFCWRKTRNFFFLCHRPGGGDRLKLCRWTG